MSYNPTTTNYDEDFVEEKNRTFCRGSYLFFGIIFFIWHAIFFAVWSYATFYSAEYVSGSTLLVYVVTGIIPSLIIVIWLILDSTTFCCNTRGQPIERTCCCKCCSSAIFMAFPIFIAACLKCGFWVYSLGALVVDFVTNTEEATEFHDELGLLMLFVIAIDAGPVFYLSVDWALYYHKKDANGILGTKRNPLRCIFAQCTVLAIVFFSAWYVVHNTLTALFGAVGAEGENPSEASENNFLFYLLIIGGAQIAQLVFAIILNFSVDGDKVSNNLVKIVCWVFGVLQFVVIILYCWCAGLAMNAGEFDGGIIAFCVAIVLYLLALTVPSMMAWFSFATSRGSGYDGKVNDTDW